MFSENNINAPGKAAAARLRDALDSCESLVIGAGAGLSTAAGFVYSGERFRKYFADFEEKYGFHDMYSGGFYPYETPEESWTYWSRYIFANRYTDAPKPVYKRLLELVRNKDYFVITTNVDHCFQKAGFDKARLFYTQGDFGLFQCSVPCHSATYDNEKVIREMYSLCEFRPLQENARGDFRERGRTALVPSGLIPRCPRCGEPMTMNLRADDSFVEDEGWHRAAGRYSAYINSHRNGRVLYLELGVGYNTPAIIKYLFWKLTEQDPDAVYACVNKGEAFCPDGISDRAILIDGDIAGVLESL